MAFKDIIGQSQAAEHLQSAAAGGKLAHAMIFSGPDGVGKKLCAVSLAQLLNCSRQAGGVACGDCSGCLKTSALSHPDLKIISPEGKGAEITIESIRLLRRGIYMKPLEGNYSVFILDDADKLNEESANALLKVLEEPPERSVLILLTSRASALQTTILSRCRIVKFRGLSETEVSEVLENASRLKEEDIGFLSKICEGSPGRALAIHGKGLENRRKVLEWFSSGGMTVENILGDGGQEAGFGGKDIQEKRESLSWLLEILLSWHRDVLLAAAGGASLLNREYEDRIMRQAQSIKISGAVEAVGIILTAMEALSLYANPKLLFENTLLSLRKLSPHNAPIRKGSG